MPVTRRRALVIIEEEEEEEVKIMGTACRLTSGSTVMAVCFET
jgi:hypothetical protein